MTEKSCDEHTHVSLYYHTRFGGGTFAELAVTSFVACADMLYYHTCFGGGTFAEFPVTSFVAGALSALECSVSARTFRRVPLLLLFALALTFADRLQFDLREGRKGQVAGGRGDGQVGWEGKREMGK